MINKLTTRSLNLRGASTFDEKTNSVRVIAVTEKPVEVFDWDRFDFVQEILRMDGVVLPKNGQVPLLDSHQRYSVKDVLGSARDFSQTEIDGDAALECVVTFADTPDGQETARKVRDGHLTDFSVGYRTLEKYWVPAGEKQIIANKVYEGPVSVVTRWRLNELSATPIGADEYSKARSEFEKQKGGIKMPENKEKQKQQNRQEEPKAPDKKQTEPKAPDTGSRQSQDLSPEEAKRIAKEAVEAERQRIAEISEMVRVAGLEQDKANEFIKQGLSVDQARAKIFDLLVEKQRAFGAGRLVAGMDERDKFREAARDGLLMRAGIKVENPAPGYETFRGRSLAEIAKECLERAGIDTRRLSSARQIADFVLGKREAVSTSDFPYLMSNLAGKRLQKAYQEAPATWRPWVNVVPASDFKDIYGISLSEAPDLELIKEDGEYKVANFKENQESYHIGTYGKIVYLTRQMIINDDLRAFMRIPQLFGAAARRREADIVYSLLTSNPKMGDGKSLFHADHANVETDSTMIAHVNSDNLSSARAKMRKQKGPNGATLDIQPRFLLVPVEQETEAEILLRSIALPQADMSSGVYNPWANRLTPIAEPRLSEQSIHTWYLVADPNQIDTIEVAYLDGNEQPYVDEHELFERDAIGFKIRHDFGAGVMDYRGFFRNLGQ